MDRINLYPEMNKEIVNILRLPGDPEEPENQVHLYAAQLIEEQAAELAAFKASGLSPERCAELAREDIPAAIDALVEYQSALPIDKAREFAKAFDEGRLVILPCKLGKYVFAIEERSNHYAEPLRKVIEPVEFEFDMREDVGTSIFLTQEEAEAALEKGGQHV